MFVDAQLIPKLVDVIVLFGELLATTINLLPSADDAAAKPGILTGVQLPPELVEI